MSLLQFILGFLIASSLYDLIKFYSKLLANKYLFKQMLKKMQAEVDALVITKTQMGDKSILQSGNKAEDEGWEEVPVSIIAPKVVKH